MYDFLCPRDDSPRSNRQSTANRRVSVEPGVAIAVADNLAAVQSTAAGNPLGDPQRLRQIVKGLTQQVAALEHDIVAADDAALLSRARREHPGANVRPAG